MNERIKELIKQAADQTSAAFSSSNFRQSEWESDFREKFAELIVQECAECVTTGTYDATPPYDVLIPVLLNELAKGMKKHFGVDQ